MTFLAAKYSVVSFFVGQGSKAKQISLSGILMLEGGGKLIAQPIRKNRVAA